jgi:hypothetical protein
MCVPTRLAIGIMVKLSKDKPILSHVEAVRIVVKILWTCWCSAWMPIMNGPPLK